MAATKKEVDYTPTRELYKKELYVMHPENSSLWEIRFRGGSRIPPELSGRFTHKSMAEEHLKKFMSRFEQ